MKVTIFNTVNAGIYLYNEGVGLLIDGLHAGEKNKFSPMPQNLLFNIINCPSIFPCINAVLFTHLHADHFDSKPLDLCMEQEVPPLVYGPELGVRVTIPTRNIGNDMDELKVGNMTITAINTEHDGASYLKSPHKSYLIRTGDETIFVAGDAIILPELSEQIKTVMPAVAYLDAVFFNIYQVQSKKSLEFLRRMNVKRIFLYHLPLPEHDIANYYKLCSYSKKRFPNDLPMFEIPEHMAWIDDNVPEV